MGGYCLFFKEAVCVAFLCAAAFSKREKGPFQVAGFEAE